MRRRNSIVLTLALAIGTATGCQTKPSGADYFWLSSESRIIFDVKVIAPLTGVIQGVAVMREDGTATVGGIEYRKVVVSFDGIPGSQSEVSYYRLGNDGIYSRKSLETAEKEILEFPLPPKVGRTWSSIQGTSQFEHEISSVEDLDTADATYQACIKISSKGSRDGQEMQVVSWYGPGVGLIKSSISASGVLIEMNRRTE